LDHEQVRERVGAAAAHVLGERDAHEAELAQALHGLVREALLAVPGGRVRLHLALAEVADRLLDVAVLVGEREVHQGTRGWTFARIQSTISCVDAPGVKTLATPALLSAGMSSSGMIPPPKTTLSPPPRRLSSSTTAGKSVRWAPERIESPTASTSSWTAASATPTRARAARAGAASRPRFTRRTRSACRCSTSSGTRSSSGGRSSGTW